VKPTTKTAASKEDMPVIDIDGEDIKPEDLPF